LERGLWHMACADEVILKELIEKHARYTASAQAQRILQRWGDYRTKFIKVFPNEYRRALGELAAKNRKIAA